MAQTAHRGHGNAAADLNRAAAGAKQREELFKATQREKDRIMEETAAYRLQGNDSKFSSTTNAVEVQLAKVLRTCCCSPQYMSLRPVCCAPSMSRE